jgi:hypothetical protein
MRLRDLGFAGRLLGRGRRVNRASATGAAMPEDYNSLTGSLNGFIGLPGSTPFFMLGVYRFLRDAIPDISDAVWTWARLCQAGYVVEMVDASSEEARERGEGAIRKLDLRVNAAGGGMDRLLEVLYTSVFTYGAAAFELVLSRTRESIHDIVPVDVATIRFKRESGGRLLPYQLQGGEHVELNPNLLFYFGIDREGTNPYGRSMLRSLPFVVKIQQRLLEDMAKATHNAGWSRLHFRYSAEERQKGESFEAYESRVNGNFEKLENAVSRLASDQNLVTMDNVGVDEIGGGRRSHLFYENHKAIEEQVITGTHLMPILLGRNYGTTETYGTAQYEIINRHVASVNRGVKRLLERVYNFELSFLWGTARAKVKMRTNRAVDVLKEATARRQEIANAIQLRDEGFVDQQKAGELLGIDSPVCDGPRSTKGQHAETEEKVC